MINEWELLEAIEPLKTVAKLPPILETGKYTMIVPYVELRREILRLAEDEREVVAVDPKATAATERF